MIDANLAELVAPLIAEFERSGMRELQLRHGDFELYLSTDGSVSGLSSKGRSGTATSSQQRPLASVPDPGEGSAFGSAITDLPEDALIVAAPNLGTFYRSPKPGAAPYVDVGTDVAEGDELCLIEVMKLFTTVSADCAGRVHAIFAQDGDMVEAGAPLFAVVKH